MLTTSATTDQRMRRMQPWKPLFQWLLFTAMISMTPFILRYVLCGVFVHSWNWRGPFESGDLYIIAIAFSSEIVGENTFYGKKMMKEMLLSFTAMMVLIFAVGLYAGIDLFSQASNGAKFAAVSSQFITSGTSTAVLTTSLALTICAWMAGVALRWPEFVTEDAEA